MANKTNPGTILTGPAWALLAAVLFGIGTPLAKFLLAGVGPQVLAGLFYLGAGVGLGIWWLITRRKSNEAPLEKRDAPWLAGAVVSGGVLGPLLLLLGLERTPSSTTALLLNLEGVFTVLLAWKIFSEHIGRRVAVGMGLILAGGLVLSWQGCLEVGGFEGPLLVVLACFCWGLDNNLTQKVSAGNPLQIAAIKGLVAGTVNLGLAFVFGSTLPTGLYLADSLGVGFISYGLSLALFILALRHLGVARTGAYFSIAPFIGATGGFILLREPLTVSLLVAGCAMAVGVWLHISEIHEHSHIHEPQTHDHRHVHDEHHNHRHASRLFSERAHSHRHHHQRLVHSGRHFPEQHHQHSH